MRDLAQYSALDWLAAKPAIALFKEARDGLLRDLYCSRRPAELDRFLSEHQWLRGRRIAVIVAYEQTWLITHLTLRLKRFVPDFHPVIFDNSPSASARAAISQACADGGVSYFALPESPIRNINRSHGNALNWVYRNVLLALEPELFVLLDHDIFPRAECDLAARLGDQPFYGHKMEWGFGWALWAGYSVFRLAAIRAARPDFNPDMDRNLVTGGRNQARLYRHHDSAALRFASYEQRHITDEVNGVTYLSELVDGWIHIGGPAFRQHKATSRAFFEPLLNDPSALDWIVNNPSERDRILDA
jgi:hypothetical protein